MMAGALLLIGVVYVAMTSINKAIDGYRRQVIALRQQISDKQRIVRFSKVEADRMVEYERRSLPRDTEKARSLYQSWLVNQVREAGFSDPVVNVIASREDNDVFHSFSLTVNGRADLKQLVNFLYDFYAADYLHRIRRLHAKRLANTRALDVSLSIDALALATAASEDSLHDQPLPVLEYDLLAYEETILGRNFNGPENRGPILDVTTEARGYTNQLISFRVGGKDPDGYDRVTYDVKADWLDEDSLADSVFNPETGQFTWTPEQPGEYELVVSATDTGFPPKTVSQVVRIDVTDEPPPEPVEEQPEPRPELRGEQFVFLTAITTASGRRQAWISIRTDGKMLKLSEGEAFDLGEVTVKVARIDDKNVELSAPVLDEQWTVGLGQSLAEGRNAMSKG
jgi:hypothetical protein